MRSREGPQLNLGFVGCGTVTARGHLPALRSLPTARVVAVSDVDEIRLRQIADRFRVERRYPDPQTLIDDPSVDAVAVCVPAQQHVSIALAVLEAGKHLFVEKPLALGLDETDRLIQQAESCSSRVMVGFNLRWHRLIQEARELLRDEAIGPVELLRSIHCSGSRFGHDVPPWRISRMTGGGEFLETAIHHFDLWCHLLQSEVDEVFAVSRSGIWDDENAIVMARMENGVHVSSLFSIRTAETHQLELFGPAGCLRASLLGYGNLELASANAPRSAILRDSRRLGRFVGALPQRTARARQGGDFVLSYREEWRHFIESIRRGSPPECSLQDGRRCLRVALAAIESASTGKPVRVRGAVREVMPNRERVLPTSPGRDC